jgi:hypothetical protein
LKIKPSSLLIGTWEDLPKNFMKHGITQSEAESVFNQIEAIRILGEQASPKVGEPRY